MADKIFVVYDPTGGRGVLDGAADALVREMIYEKGVSTALWRIGTDNVITALRVAVKEGRVAPDEVEVKFRDEFLYFTKDARVVDKNGFDHWPVGFCDYAARWFERLYP